MCAGHVTCAVVLRTCRAAGACARVHAVACLCPRPRSPRPRSIILLSLDGAAYSCAAREERVGCARRRLSFSDDAVCSAPCKRSPARRESSKRRAHLSHLRDDDRQAPKLPLLAAVQTAVERTPVQLLDGCACYLSPRSPSHGRRQLHQAARAGLASHRGCLSSLRRMPISARQQLYLTIAWMPIVFGVSACVSLFGPRSSVMWWLLRSQYEAIALSTFGTLLFLLLVVTAAPNASAAPPAFVGTSIIQLLASEVPDLLSSP